MAVVIRLALAAVISIILVCGGGYAGSLITEASDLKLALGIGLMVVLAVAAVAVIRFVYRTVARYWQGS